jgi:hypothetical protein
MTIEEQITIFEHNAEHERKEGDLHNSLHFRQLAEWLKELKTHREAWEKVRKRLRDKHSDPYSMHCAESYFIGVYDAMKIVDKYRPKEGDSNASAD